MITNAFNPRRWLQPTAFCLWILLLWIASPDAHGIILLGTGDPAANTTAPTGDLANSGWQFQGIYGGFLGTTIAPSFFMTAKHVNGTSSVFVYEGITHNLLEGRTDPYSDLSIWHVDGTFSSYAPLYSSSNETGQRLVVFGRGTQRGEQVVNGTPRGWKWGDTDSVQRWGENTVTSIVSGGPVNQYVYAAFDVSGSPNEAHLSSGDSGGGVFIFETRQWKLAAINYSVDGPLYTTSSGGGQFDAALYDARGFYYSNPNGGFDMIAGPAAVPTGFYSTRISSKLPWIYSVIDPNGDADGNGANNLVDYARSLNSPAPAGPGAPTVVKEGNLLSIVYRKLAIANPPHYNVQKSADLISWTTVTPTETLLEVIGDIRTVKAQVPSTGNRMFLRVQITSP